MKSDDGIARYYAETLYSTVEDKEKTLNFLLKLKEAIDESKEFKLILSHPYIEREDKLKAIEGIIGIKLGRYMRNFLNILMDYHHVNEIDRICSEFNNLYMQSSKIQPVMVFTAAKIPSGSLNRLKSVLEEKTGKRIRLQVVIDKELIGGIKIGFDNRVYDGSIKKILSDFKDSGFQGVV